MRMRIWIVVIVVLQIGRWECFAFSNRLDVLGFGGYSEANQFSDATLNTNFDKMTGYNAGGMILITLANRRVAPVMGAGGEYMLLRSKVPDSTNTWELNNTLTSQAATGHLGLRATGARFRLFLLGDIGYGLSDKVESQIQTISDKTILSTTTYKMKNHILYGGTAALLIGLSRAFKIGIGGVYHLHSVSMEDQSIQNATSTTYQEVSGNIVFNLSF